MKVDWANLGTKLGLKGSTAQALASFKKRNDDARRRVQILSEQASTVDFSAYRSQLKNTAIVDDLQKQFSGFTVKKYDVSRQIKAIEAFEAQAVKSAEETKGKVDMELADLEKTLKNIESARPFEDLTVVCTRSGEGVSRDEACANEMSRTRSRLHAQTSTSACRSSCPRAGGACRATTRSSAACRCCRQFAWCGVVFSARAVYRPVHSPSTYSMFYHRCGHVISLPLRVEYVAGDCAYLLHRNFTH